MACFKGLSNGLFSVFFLRVFVRLFLSECVFLLFTSFIILYFFHNLTSFIILYF